MIEEWYVRALSDDRKRLGITISEVYKEALNNQFNSKMSKFDEMEIATVMKEHLKLHKVRNVRAGVRAIRWYKDLKDAEDDSVPVPAKYLEEMSRF